MVFLSYIIAILQLISVTFITFLAGLHDIIFSGLSIVGYDIMRAPMRHDRKKMSYIDKLNISNLDLYGVSLKDRNSKNSQSNPEDEEDDFGEYK